VSDPRIPAGVESLIRAITRGSSDEDRDRRATTFARGLAMGALVGAAIAGSTIWQRRQASTVSDPPRLAGGSTGPDDEPVNGRGPAGGPTDR
jgi:hypothetical protein